jgi:hypothetical protein
LFIHTFKNSGIPAASDSESSEDGSDDISSDAHSEYEVGDTDDADEDSEPAPAASVASLDGDRQKTLIDQTFGNFEDLKKYVESITFVTMSNNKRTTRFQSAPVWFKEAFPDADICWLSGTLYCHQPRKESYDQYVKWAKTTCTCKVRYALCSKTKRWRISEFNDCHNHEVQSQVETSATGIVHIRNAARLNQDMIVAINNWLDAHISEYIQLFRAPTHQLTPSRNQRD